MRRCPCCDRRSHRQPPTPSTKSLWGTKWRHRGGISISVRLGGTFLSAPSTRGPYLDSRLRRQRLPTKPDSAEGQPEVYRSHVGTKWAAHDAVDPRPARSVRGATEPGPESRPPKLGNLGSTTWNPTSPEPRRAGVPVVSSVPILHTRIVPKRRQHNSREPVLVGRRQDQNKPPIGPGRAPVNRRRRVSGGGWETVRWRQNLLRIQTSASIRLCDGETQWPGVCGIPST